jgi:hypothetical protein
MSKIEKNQQKIIILINFQLKTTIKKHSPPPHQTNTQWAPPHYTMHLNK